MEQKKKTVTIQLEEALYQKIRVLAIDGNRTVPKTISQMVRYNVAFLDFFMGAGFIQGWRK